MLNEMSFKISILLGHRRGEIPSTFIQSPLHNNITPLPNRATFHIPHPPPLHPHACTQHQYGVFGLLNIMPCLRTAESICRGICIYILSRCLLRSPLSVLDRRSSSSLDPLRARKGFQFEKYSRAHGLNSFTASSSCLFLLGTIHIV